MTILTCDLQKITGEIIGRTMKWATGAPPVKTLGNFKDTLLDQRALTMLPRSTMVTKKVMVTRKAILRKRVLVSCRFSPRCLLLLLLPLPPADLPIRGHLKALHHPA
jgi:hypothetical protein